MFKKIAIAFVVILVAFLAFVATRPSEYTVERSTEINAPQETVFATVVDYKRFNEWSPWAARDPAMKTTIKGEGQGATYEWSGNDQVGTGKMTHTKVNAPDELEQALEFITPFESKATTGFKLAAAAGEKTKITWWMKGNNDFMAKLMGVFMDMEGMIGGDYESGLKKLKTLVEKEADAAAAAKLKAEEEAKAKAEAEAASAGDAGPAPTGDAAK